jgi:hypothetical protein
MNATGLLHGVGVRVGPESFLNKFSTGRHSQSQLPQSDSERTRIQVRQAKLIW